MKSISILTTYLTGGGAEKVAVTIANELTKYCDVHLISTYRSENHVSNIKCHYTSLGFHCNRQKTTIKNILYILKLPLVIIKYMKELQHCDVDVSLSILTVDNIVNMISCILTNRKAIISIHGNPYNKHLPLLAKLAKKSELFLAKVFSVHVIVVSHHIKYNIIQKSKLLSEKVSVIYNPIDIDSIKSSMFDDVFEEVYDDDSDVPILINVGSLYPVKGQKSLIRVFAKCRKTLKCKLVICGEGRLRSELEEVVRELGLEDDVIFLGWCNNPHKYMTKSSLFVLSSYSEGLPLALIEALICDCSILATDCSGGVREILKDGKYGYICSALESINIATHAPLTPAEESMLEGMKRILSDINLCQKMKEGREEWIQEFEKNHVIQKYYQVINDCMEDKNES